jgi:hypothetical protein
MITFSEFLNESYVNLFKPDEKKVYADEVFALLQNSYKKVGGLKGSGFNSPDDMVARIPFWKLVRKNDKIVAAVFYKDSGGRKLVALGTDGSPEGKAAIVDLMKAEITRQRSYSEVSEPVVSFIKKYVLSNLEQYMIPADQVSEILGKEIRITGKYTYTREIGGNHHEKLMFGKPGVKFY